MRFALVAVGLQCGWASCEAKPEPPSAPVIPAGSASEEQGKIWVEVRYDSEGKVKTCRIIRSNAPVDLELSTVDYISQHWHCLFLAGQTLLMPIIFDPAPTANYWLKAMVPPPDPFPPDDPEHDMRLRITFGDDGWVREVHVLETSGDDSADKQTEAWVKVHWHNQDYAGKVIDVPFDFQPLPPKPTPAPAPVVVTAPKETEQKPIPAWRAQ
jgi:hypothetical protein